MSAKAAALLVGFVRTEESSRMEGGKGHSGDSALKVRGRRKEAEFVSGM